MAEEVAANVEFADEVKASLPELAPASRPEGISEEYRFFTNVETGQVWKAKLVIQEARPASVDTDKELAPANLAVTVTVSPVDEAGKALRENDKPIVIDSWTHTFNEVEMSEPDFDPQERIMNMVAERVKAGEARLAGFNKVRSFVGKW